MGVKNMTYKKYEIMKEKQNNCCKIRGTNKKELNNVLCLDHNHNTGEIRGILCNKYNRLLRNAKDNIDILELVMNYLQKVPEKC